MLLHNVRSCYLLCNGIDSICLSGQACLLIVHKLVVARSIFLSFTFGTMAPKSEKRRPDDAALESQGPPAAPVNATIWKDMLEPAIQYISDLPQFEDWDCPQPLKACNDTVGEFVGFMAPLSNKRLHPGIPLIVTLHSCGSISTLRPQILSNTRGCLGPSLNRCRNQRRHPESGRLPPAKSCNSNWGDRLHIPSSAIAKRDPHRLSAQPCPQTQTWRDV